MAHAGLVSTALICMNILLCLQFKCADTSRKEVAGLGKTAGEWCSFCPISVHPH